MRAHHLGAALISIGLALTSGCGAENPTAAHSPGSTPLACTASGSASGSWSPLPIVSAAASGDILTLTFGQGTPAFEVKPQSNADFQETTGRGGAVHLAGSAGVLITLRGFRGDMTNYSGPVDYTPRGAVLVEARHLGDFEGVMGWAAGLAQAGCANATATGSTLTFRFITSS